MNRRFSRKKQPFETYSKAGHILQYYHKYYPDLIRQGFKLIILVRPLIGRDFKTRNSEWEDQATEICPVKTRDINTWTQNLTTFGNIDPNKDIENREMLLRLSKSFLHDCIKY